MTTVSTPRVDAEMASYIKLMLNLGMFTHQIAAKFGINQGRVSEIKTGKRFDYVAPARDLPPSLA
jgi:ABC-type dipeptide/oligopeptide/nickel transport system permease component